METKRKLQITVDILMIFVLLMLMSYSIAGELLHEILGISMFVLFIIHHILSFSYLKALFKGRQSADKIIKIIIDSLLTVVMLAMMISAVPLSKHLFTFLGIRSFSGIGRTVHLLGAYWGFALMSLHIGFHLDFMLSKIMRDKKKKPAAISIMILLAGAGLIILIREGIYKYMLLINQFVFFDEASGLLVFILKYILILCMFAAIGYLIIRLTKRR